MANTVSRLVVANYNFYELKNVLLLNVLQYGQVDHYSLQPAHNFITKSLITRRENQNNTDLFSKVCGVPVTTS